MTFKGKHKHSKNENPGPSHYNIINGTYYFKSSGFRLGSEKRKTAFDKSNEVLKPGPGQHSPQTLKLRPSISYTILGKP